MPGHGVLSDLRQHLEAKHAASGLRIESAPLGAGFRGTAFACSKNDCPNLCVKIQIHSQEIADREVKNQRQAMQILAQAAIQTRVPTIYWEEVCEVSRVRYHCIFMDGVNGHTLSDLLKDQASFLHYPGVRYTVLNKLILACEHLAGDRLAHHDITTKNVMVSPPASNGNIIVWLIDFGKSHHYTEAQLRNHGQANVLHLTHEAIQSVVEDGRAVLTGLKHIIRLLALPDAKHMKQFEEANTFEQLQSVVSACCIATGTAAGSRRTS